MVSVQHQFPPLTGDDSTDIQSWVSALSGTFEAQEIELIKQACEFAAPLYQGSTDITGTPLLQHALGSAAILIGLNMDHEAIAATALHAVPDFLPDAPTILKERFGPNVAGLVDGISRMEHVRQFSEVRGTQGAEEAAQQVETLRKMLLAMVEDIRVVLIKLAERTQTLRHLSHADEAVQRQVAQDTQSIFAPLANRLGVWQIKWELEDLSMRYLEPGLYKQIAKSLDEKRVDRERYITDLVAQLQQTLKDAGIDGEVSGRPKHIYSIINKMKRKHLDFDELYDVRAVRILVDDIEQCYAALSLVHELWLPIQKEFDDYIAKPKPNGYSSLHTAVLGPRRLSVEVQIRTRQMHHDSELGVAAHWRYKENKKSEGGLDEKVAWLRQVLAWKAELADSGELQEQLSNELIQDRVYVLTPQGKVIDLPTGATPVDFAYVLHTNLGHRTRGAKVDGNIVPLKHQLQTGQRVEILTVKQGGPSRDWANPQLGYLKSSRARAKVRHWFSEQNLDDSISQGRALLDRELHRVGVNDINLEKLAQQLRYNKPDDLYAALGRGDITPRRASLALVREAPPQRKVASSSGQSPVPKRVSIEGESSLTYKFALCCHPAFPAHIIGYVTRDRGITIHRHDCPFMQRVPEEREDRLLDAKWTS
ncbi:MAG: bifunctional (p)ppGpp synthetase/guanosine-3',5'-bis(diphosphate) 3'-pyrophosphohydrolase [Gammaproteobacteria bacterium]|nr:bifunctional (p)ppGpp synthetase/guanosine-3',5'-bis(diphosphate) 3'-pyrophosphohydrolase [Gammaproteobacteria bacterium]MBU1624338.1 bifunctional (p)ppGpp synthetase/guanosine-3',5'-bis(diphosphate) 3'-pyrophosphohydrolase [Gammaproteobacteria bacterium]MBU1981066.1 bifunctional (p)ppGpp synthetase/guanosine-3',5'-bis(diphosphate) 3'-pyrophosphohydrolase [Gammaproteobacteria bacterium]